MIKSDAAIVNSIPMVSLSFPERVRVRVRGNRRRARDCDLIMDIRSSHFL